MVRQGRSHGVDQLHLDARIGAIELGKCADLSVLGADLFRVQPERIHTLPVLLTLMAGRVTHDGLVG